MVCWEDSTFWSVQSDTKIHETPFFESNIWYFHIKAFFAIKSTAKLRGKEHKLKRKMIFEQVSKKLLWEVFCLWITIADHISLFFNECHSLGAMCTLCHVKMVGYFEAFVLQRTMAIQYKSGGWNSLETAPAKVCACGYTAKKPKVSESCQVIMV